jgi:hypothetical protein
MRKRKSIISFNMLLFLVFILFEMAGCMSAVAHYPLDEAQTINKNIEL